MNEYEIRFTLANISNKIKLKLLQMYNNEENIYNNIDNIIKEKLLHKNFRSIIIPFVNIYIFLF